jgi:hypothetical protein
LSCHHDLPRIASLSSIGLLAEASDVGGAIHKEGQPRKYSAPAIVASEVGHALFRAENRASSSLPIDEFDALCLDYFCRFCIVSHRYLQLLLFEFPSLASLASPPRSPVRSPSSGKGKIW